MFLPTTVKRDRWLISSKIHDVREANAAAE